DRPPAGARRPIEWRTGRGGRTGRLDATGLFVEIPVVDHPPAGIIGIEAAAPSEGWASDVVPDVNGFQRLLGPRNPPPIAVDLRREEAGQQIPSPACRLVNRGIPDDVRVVVPGRPRDERHPRERT